jgi:uncharacterized protein (DUF433 family)
LNLERDQDQGYNGKRIQQLTLQLMVGKDLDGLATSRITMKTDIQIVGRGRGLQLSTSRITVQDLVPYFQEGCNYEEIMRWIPTLTVEEIAVVDRYYREHQAELEEEDRLIRERTEARVRQQRQRFPEIPGTPEERLARLRGLLEKQRQEKKR